MALDPNAVDTMYNKAGVLSNLGRYQEGITYYGKVLSIDPTDSDALSKKMRL